MPLYIEWMRSLAISLFILTSFPASQCISRILTDSQSVTKVKEEYDQHHSATNDIGTEKTRDGSTTVAETETAKRPHILFILADDMGWNDVSWNTASDIDTPNLSRLARRGIIFNRTYAQASCSPSRAALLSGRYPFTIGMQVSTVDPLRPYGLPTDVPLLSDYLKSLGYSTHAVGKWHLGFCKEDYTPTKRGFDSFYGFHGGHIGYFHHSNNYKIDGYSYKHTDFWRNLENIGGEVKGQYTTFLLADEVIGRIFNHSDKSKPLFIYLAFSAPHGPFQVLGKDGQWDGVRQSSRELFGAMISAMDTAVGRIMKALKVANMIRNTLVVFTSDNGGTEHEGNNYPLRGIKTTLYEGGTRVPTFIFGPKRIIRRRKYTTNALMHLSDWFPTLYSLAGGSAKDLPADLTGYDLSETITKQVPSPRKELVYNIQTRKGQLSSGAIRDSKWKLIVGTQGKDRDLWYCTTPLLQAHSPHCMPSKHDITQAMPVNGRGSQTTFSLFDLENDPSETNNLLVGLHRRNHSEQHYILRTFQHLQGRLQYYKSLVKPSVREKSMKEGDLKKYGKSGWC